MDETKLLKENILQWRYLITESAGDLDVIKRAIDNKTALYISYAGDNTVTRGYRLVYPFLIGTTSKGNVALRAWERSGVSDSAQGVGVNPRRSEVRERDKLGSWRLFLVSGITSAFPTNKKLEKDPKYKEIIADYNENDTQLTNIGPAISISGHGGDDTTVKTTGLDSMDTNISMKNISPNEFNELVKQKSAEAYHIIQNKEKKSPSNYILVNVNNQIYFDLQKNSTKYQPNQLIGNVLALFNQYHRQNKPSEKINKSFFTNQGIGWRKKPANFT